MSKIKDPGFCCHNILSNIWNFLEIASSISARLKIFVHSGSSNRACTKIVLQLDVKDASPKKNIFAYILINVADML